MHPRLLKALDVDAEVHVFELDLERISQRSLPISGELSRFPSLRRDIAVVLSDEVRFARIEAAVRQALGDRLVELVLFDRYSDKNLGIGVSSLAMGLILQDRSRTLSDQDADHCVELAVSALATEFAARLRGRMALTKAEMAERLFIDVGLNKREAKEFVDAFFESIRDALERGEQIKLSGFGNFDLRLKNERPGRNPKTGEEIPISARRVVTFRPGQKLKVRVEAYAGSGE